MCTFINSSSSSSCEMCMTPHGGSYNKQTTYNNKKTSNNHKKNSQKAGT
jgi:hypothetical protein